MLKIAIPADLQHAFPQSREDRWKALDTSLLLIYPRLNEVDRRLYTIRVRPGWAA